MKALFVAWQEPESHHWTPVGRLTQEDDEYHFVYTCGAKIFPNFIPFGRMKDLDVEYISEELFPLFSNRVLPKSRPEYKAYLDWLGMSDISYDALEELARTGGLRATDSVELFPCPEPTEKNTYEVYFFTRGLNYLHTENVKRTSELKVGESLYIMQDVQNEIDEMALLLRTGDPISLVGYAPKYYSSEFSQLISILGNEGTKVTVERINLDAPMQYRVLCKLSSPWPVGFYPCSEGEYKPVTKMSCS